MCYREKLEDDVCSFGFILLEVLMGPKLHDKGDPFILKDLVCCATYLYYKFYKYWIEIV